MTRGPVTIDRKTLAVEALQIMEHRKITSIVVVDAFGQVEGVVHLHHLWDLTRPGTRSPALEI
jgi:arabinose-5-phosphate isomerase